MHSGFLSFLNRSFDSFKNSLMLDKGTFQLIPTYLLTIFISNLVRVKKSLLCLGHREALIAWPVLLTPLLKDITDSVPIFCAHRFLRCHPRTLCCKSNATRLQRRLTPPAHPYVIALVRPCALPPKQKAPARSSSFFILYSYINHQRAGFPIIGEVG